MVYVIFGWSGGFEVLNRLMLEKILFWEEFCCFCMFVMLFCISRIVKKCCCCGMV